MSQTVYAADTFNRADSNSTLGDTDTGIKTWLQSGGVIGIQGGQAYRVSNTVAAPHAYIDPGHADYIVEAEVTLSPTTDRAMAGIMFRRDGTLLNYLLLTLRKVAGQNDIRLQKNDDNVGVSLLGTAVNGAGLANGVKYLCRCTISGADITAEVFLGTTLIATIPYTMTPAEAAVFTANNCGIRWRVSTTEDDGLSKFDNFKVYTEVEDPPDVGGFDKVNGFENGLSNGTTLTPANSGYGAPDPVVQAPATAGTATTANTVAMGAFADAVHNGLLLFDATNRGSGGSLTQEGGFTELGELSVTEFAERAAVAWRIGEDLTPTYVSDSNASFGVIAVEVQAGLSAIVMSLLDSGIQETDNTVFSTASVSPTAGSEVFLCIFGSRASATPPNPVVVGNGGTYVLVASVPAYTTGGNTRSAWIYRFHPTSSGAISMTFANTMQNVGWFVVQVIGTPQTVASPFDRFRRDAVTVTTDTSRLIAGKTRGGLCHAAATTGVGGTNHLSGVEFTTFGALQSWEVIAHIPNVKSGYKLVKGRGADGDEAWSVVIRRNGKVEVRDNQDKVVATSVAALAKGTIIKIAGEAEIDPSAVSGNRLTVALYDNPASTQPIEPPMSVAGIHIGNPGDQLTAVGWGVLSAVSVATDVVLNSVRVTNNASTPPVAEVLVDDDFDRTDGTNLGTDLTGKAWNEDEGDFIISGNRLALNTPLAGLGDLKGICEDSPAFDTSDPVKKGHHPAVVGVLPNTRDILVGGDFDIVGAATTGVSYLVRLNRTASGYVESGINFQCNGIVWGVAVLSSTSVIVTGEFTSIGGSARPGIAAINPTNGALLSQFSGWSIFGDPPNPTTKLPGGCAYDPETDSLFVAGQFTTVQGQARNRFVKINTVSGTPTVDATWVPVNGSTRGRNIYVIDDDGTKRVALQLDTGGGGSTIEGHNAECAVVDFDTGDAVWWTNYGVGGTIDMNYSDDLQMLAHGSRGSEQTSGNSSMVYRAGGTGLQTQLWRHGADGNCQAVGFLKGGLSETRVYAGHHDQGVASAPNINDNSIPHRGLVRYFAQTGELDQTGFRARFPGGLEVFLVDGDEINGRLFVGGPFDQVTNWAQTQTKNISRFAIFESQGTGIVQPSTSKAYIDPGRPDYRAEIDVQLSVPSVSRWQWASIFMRGGGGMSHASFDPNDSRNIALATDVGGPEISRDGYTYAGKQSGLFMENHRKTACIECFDNPASPGSTIIYAFCGDTGSDGAIIRSTDLGETWDHRSTAVGFASQNQNFDAPFLDDPRSNGRVAILDSTGGGDGHLYMASYNNGLYRSDDGGLTATRIAFPPITSGSIAKTDRYFLRCLAFHPTDKTKVFVGIHEFGQGSGGFWRMDSARTAGSVADGGAVTATPLSITVGGVGRTIESVDDILFIGTTGYVAAAHDGIFRFEIASPTVWTDITPPGHVLTGGAAGNTYWRAIGGSADGTGKHVIGVGCAMPARVGANGLPTGSGNRYGSIYRHLDAHTPTAPNDAGWDYCTDPGTSPGVWNADISVTDWATGVVYWTDGTTNQNNLLGRRTSQVNGIQQASPGSTTWIAVGAGGAIWRSEDNMAHWRITVDGIDIMSMRGVAIDPVRPGYLLAVGSDHDGGWSDNYGQSWVNIVLGNGNTGYGAFIDWEGVWYMTHGEPANDGNVYRAMTNVVGGVKDPATVATFAPTAAPPAPGLRLFGITVGLLSNGTTKRIVVYAEDGGIRYSDNAGASWSTPAIDVAHPAGTSAGQAFEWDLLWPNRNTGVLFLMNVDDQSIWRSTDRGANWTELIGLPVSITSGGSADGIREGYLAVADGQTAIGYYSDSNMVLYRVNHLDGSGGAPARDTITGLTGVRSVTFDEDGGLYVYCRPLNDTERAKLLYCAAPSTANSSVTTLTFVDLADPADQALDDRLQEKAGIGVNHIHAFDNHVYVANAGSGVTGGVAGADNRASAGLGFRRTSPSGYWLVRLDDFDGSRGVSLWKYVEGGNPVQRIAPTGAINAGSEYHIVVVVEGDTIAVEVTDNANDSLVAAFNYTMTPAEASTYTGTPVLPWLRFSPTEDDGSSTWDNLLVTSLTVVPPPSPSMTGTPSSLLTVPGTVVGTLSDFIPGETIVLRLDNPTTGTVLAGSVSPSPIPPSGGASYSATIPGSASAGAHFIYAVGTSGSIASFAFSVGSAQTSGFLWSCTPPYGGGGANSMTVTKDGNVFVAEDVGGIRASFNPATADPNDVVFQPYQKGVYQEELRRAVATIVAGETTDTHEEIVVAGFGKGQSGGTALWRDNGTDAWSQFNTDLRFQSQTESQTGDLRSVKELLAQDITPNGVNDLGTWYGADLRGYIMRSNDIGNWVQITTGNMGRIRWVGVHPGTRDLYFGVYDNAGGSGQFGLYRVASPYTGTGKVPVRVTPSTIRTVEYGLFAPIGGVTTLLICVASSGTDTGIWRTSVTTPVAADWVNASGSLPTTAYYLSIGGYNNGGSLVAMIGTDGGGQGKMMYRNTNAVTGTTWNNIAASAVTHTLDFGTDGGAQKFLNAGGGRVNAIKPDLSSAAGASKRWYALAGASWLYRSNDNGATWHNCPDEQGGVGKGLTIWSNNFFMLDPTRPGWGLLGNQDHDFAFTTDYGLTWARCSPSGAGGVTIGHWTYCDYAGVWWGGNNDDLTNTGFLCRSNNSTNGGSTPNDLVAVLASGRVIGGVVGKNGSGNKRIVVYRDGGGTAGGFWYTDDATGSSGWVRAGNTPTVSFIGANTLNTPNVPIVWPTPQTTQTIYAFLRGSGVWRSNDAGANWTQIVVATGADTRRGYVASFEPTTCYYTELDGKVYRIRNANSTPVVDAGTTISVDDAAAIGFGSDGALLVFCVPTSAGPGKFLRALAPVPKTGDIPFTNAADPNDAAANDVAEETLLHVNTVTGNASHLYAVINGASCLAGTFQ